MKFNRQNILVSILVVSLLIGAYVWYSYFFSGATEETLPAQSTPVVSRQFLARVELLGRIDIDVDFLRSQEVLDLEPVAQLPQIPQNRGRINPFAGF